VSARRQRETASAGEGAGLAWPLPEDLDDEALEVAAIPCVAGAGHDQGAAAAAGLASDPLRAAASDPPQSLPVACGRERPCEKITHKKSASYLGLNFEAQ
jgi:hypothetical protein